ncbi:MAG: transposase [Gammaproteobacteria bacterium]|jgi:transposase|nr:transposase [Gammaproteobacteria bacterium]
MAEVTNPQRVLGCDVGKDTIVIFDSLTSTAQTVANTAGALKRVMAGLGDDTLIVCEATGGHEATLLAIATQAGMPAHRADPRKARAFIRSLRSHGKTDVIDAQALARYGLERRPELSLWHPPSAAQNALQSMVRLRADLVRDRADYTRRLKAPGDGPDKAHIRATIEALTDRIAALQVDIDNLVSHDRKLATTVTTIQDIPGCGPKTAIALAALMPELGQMTRRQAAALAGLAPHPKQSGQTDAYRRVRGGRRDAKTALFLAAMAARRFNPDLRRHYDSLRERGKKPIVAIIAIARKLITIINARIRDAFFPPTHQLC